MLQMLIGSMIVMRVFPDLPIARQLHRWLVEAPAARLARLHPAQVIFVIIVGGVLLAGGEIILLMGGAEAAMALSWQLSLYLDAGAALAVASAIARVRPFLMLLKPRPMRPRTAARRRRERVTSSPFANDDDRPAIAA